MGRFTHWLRSERGKTFVTVTVIGIIGLAVGVPVSSRLREPYNVIWFELFAAILILGGVEILIRGIEAWMETRDERDFRRFFGNGVVAKGTLAVFPTAEPPVLEGGFADLIYRRPPPAAAAKKGRAKGIQHVVPYEDLKAVLALSAVFQRMRVSLKMALDSHLEDDWELAHPLIGIGLGFNHVTAKVAALCPELYSIIFDSGTDDFLFNKTKHGFPKDQQDCALVVRVVRHGIPHFVCAGRTAAGTQAAGVFLAHEWKTLLSIYDKEDRDLKRDSLAVLLRFPEMVPDEAELERTCFSPSKKHLPDESDRPSMQDMGDDDLEQAVGL